MSATVTAPAGASVTLRVVEARFQDVGRARARLDPGDMLRLGATAFGGPAAHVGLMEDESDLSMAAAASLARFRRDFDAEVIAPRLLSFVMDADGAATTSRSGPERVRS